MGQMVNYQLGGKSQHITLLKDKRIPESRKNHYNNGKMQLLHPRCLVGFVLLDLCFICIFGRALFVLLSCIFWPLCCLSFFDLGILIIPLVSWYITCQSVIVESVEDLRFYCTNHIKKPTYLRIFKLQNRISGVIVNMFASSVVDNVLAPLSGQT